MIMFNTHKLDKALTGPLVEQRIQYWSSYDDHIDRIKQEIEANEDDILETKQAIKDLKAELKRVEKEKKAFTEDKYEQSYHFAESYQEEHPEFCSNALNKIKAHELHCHPELAGRFLCESGARLTGNVPLPRYEFVGAGSDPLHIKYIYCMDCLKKGNKDYILYLEEKDGHK